MNYVSDAIIVSRFYRNFKFKVASSVVITYVLVLGLYYTQVTPNANVIVLLAVALTSLYCIAVLKGASNDFKRGNMTVNELEVNDANVKIKTFDFSFLKLIKKPAIEVIAQRNLIEFYVSPERYSFSESIVGDLYILSYAGDKFLICEKFFNNFNLLKEELSNKSKLTS